jgi:sulfate permease, SulP family
VRTRAVILRMRHVLAMDATGLHALEDVAQRLRRRGTRLLLSGVHAQPLIALERSGALERIGTENVFESFDEALAAARSA